MRTMFPSIPNDASITSFGRPATDRLAACFLAPVTLLLFLSPSFRVYDLPDRRRSAGRYVWPLVMQSLPL